MHDPRQGVGARLAPLLALAIVGCSAHARVRTAGSPNDEEGAAAAAAPAPTPAPEVSGIRRWVDVLERNGIIPINVEVLAPDLTPLPHLRVRVFDDTLERYEGTTDDLGVASMQVPTPVLPRWDVYNDVDGRWETVARPKIVPSKSGMGLRAVIVLGVPSSAPPPPPPGANPSSFPAAEPPDTVERLYARGREAEEAGDHVKAERYYRLARQRATPGGQR